MVVGCIGSVPFYVSSNTVKTFQALQYSGAARYATHQLAGGATLLEFTGTDPAKLQLDILLSAYLGVSPASELATLERYEYAGTVLPVVLGDWFIGRGGWVIASHSLKMQHTDKYGTITSAQVSLSLQEYQ